MFAIVARRRCLAAILPLVLLGAFGTAGKAGAAEEHEARSARYLTVCGDPNNLPFSNDKYEGFENKIAELIAGELQRPLYYRWWPQTVGFVRNTLRARLCDLIMGVASQNELLQNTNPYYRSVYSLVYRADGPHVSSLKDPRVRGMRLAVVAGTPPATLLRRYDLLGNTRSYQRTVDTRHDAPARQAVHDVAAGDRDLAIVWGPIAGYFARREETKLRVEPLPARVDGVQLAFNVSMGIRHREKEWKHQLNALLEKLEPRIQAILLGYGVPLLDDNNRPVGPMSAAAD